MHSRLVSRIAVGLVAISAPCAMSAYAQSLPPSAPAGDMAPAPASVAAPSATTSTSSILNRQSLQAFFAGLMPYAIGRADIAGAVVAVVKDGKLIFTHGYGTANVKTQAPVIPDKTLFRIGSVSKLFTWTAVMQLVQAGKINLDRNVNAYLDFKIPKKFGKPITMRDLMTHTPGFAETIRDLIFVTPNKLIPLRSYLIQNMPRRIFPPGKIVAYSNYGAALAGYIVQRLSGEPFDQYVKDHILEPLGMQDTTFAQPLPKSWRPDMAQGYITASHGPMIPFEDVEPYPAGSVSSTATNMARFMIAQLQHGEYDGVSILSPATVALMHSTQYRAAPGMNGFDLGFYQQNRNGLQIIGHGGDTIAFHSALHLIPAADVGLFMAFNSAGKGGAVEKVRMALFRKFLNHYFPYEAPKEKTAADPQRDAARVAGWYLATRREEHALSLFYMLTQDHVTALPNGEIEDSMLTSQAGAPLRWREVGPLDYRQVHGQDHLKFVAAPNGRIRYWISSAFPPIELFQRVDGLRQLNLLKTLTGIAVAVFVLTLIIWFGGWIARRHFHASLELSRSQFWLRLASRIGVVMQLAVVVGWLILLMWVSKPLGLVIDIAPALMLLYVIGVLGVIGGVLVIAEASWRIVRGPGFILCRSGEALLALCALYGIWAIFAYGLANFSTHF